jgi:class 3 adenylate cyclase
MAVSTTTPLADNPRVVDSAPDESAPNVAHPTSVEPALTRGFMFCDLRGYTTFVEAHGDRAAAELLDALTVTLPAQ